MNANDIETALRARAAFNDSVECIDANTRRRLRELRLQALNGKPRHAHARWMWPAGAALTAALALAVFLPRLPQAPNTTTHAAPTTIAMHHTASPASAAREIPNSVVETATSDSAETPSLETTDPDMLSNLDFYGWLAKQPNTGNTGG
ncbi:MAG TPA: hypothetical protein VGT79_05650 [Xanthomonadaceae bacterium]|nr:hypothetical protein [Xanthomonadaceae bacterium]